MEVKRPLTAQEEYKKETGHEAKHLETAKKAYNPDDLSEEKMKKQHQAIWMSKHGG